MLNINFLSINSLNIDSNKNFLTFARQFAGSKYSKNKTAEIQLF